MTDTRTEPNQGLRRHKLLTEDLRKALPALYSTENDGTADKMLIVKFFSPYSQWSWYGVEFDGVDTFFGFVQGHENEWGTFSFSELAETTLFGDVPAVERDLSFTPTRFSDLF